MNAFYNYLNDVSYEIILFYYYFFTLFTYTYFLIIYIIFL